MTINFDAHPSEQTVTPPASPTDRQTNGYTEGIPYADTEEFAREGWTGQSLAGEHWYLCARCQRPVKKSDTIVQYGLRMCARHADEPGTDDFREEATNSQSARIAREADSANKEP